MENRFQTTYNALKHLSSGAYQTRGMMGTETANPNFGLISEEVDSLLFSKEKPSKNRK